jgi:hypothetical protein
MRSIVLFTVSCFLLSIIFGGCKKQDGEKEFDKENNLIAFLDGPNEALLVNPAYTDTVLVILQAEKIELTDSFRTTYWFVRDGESKIYFDIFETDSPYVYTFFEGYDWYDSTRTYYPYYYIKLYNNADCGKVHPGFVAPCIGTFGRHRLWGNSMQWQVNEWKSCTSGENICVEAYSKVGTIEYYQDPNCQDISFIQRDIYRWACAN